MTAILLEAPAGGDSTAGEGTTMNDERKITFEFKRDEAAPAESFPLELNGKVVAECVGSMDGLSIIEMASLGSISARERPAIVQRFLKKCFDDENYEKFAAAVAGLGLDVADVAEVAQVLSDVYSARPTMSPEPSGAGDTTTGSSSEESSSSQESTGRG